jgi:signal transduction histidine kinase
MSVLLDDLFELAQLDAGGLVLERETNSLGDLISDTIEAQSALAESRAIRLEGQVAQDLDPVCMDARLIGRVLNNILENALRHTPAHGRIRISAFSLAGRARVEVSDTGEGIAPHDLAHVFERFYRGERSRSRDSGGAGLGLAIARGLVEAHGGEIGIESAPGTGTLVWFDLPR